MILSERIGNLNKINLYKKLTRKSCLLQLRKKLMSRIQSLKATIFITFMHGKLTILQYTSIN